MILRRVVLTICFAFLLCGALMAQSNGIIKGTILDPSGAAIPKATVTMTGPNNDVKVAETDNNGEFSVAGLAPGKYTVRVIAAAAVL